ncbi:hypothetical protein CL634_01475 [bacterium]|nr:hypothetical protein [bacterium]
MPTNKNIPIKYTSRDFASIKRDLIDYAKRYYPETYRDFSEASFGSLMTDAVAYVGDILSFYLDYQINESFLDSAIEYDNVIRLAQQLGYKFQGNPTSYGVVTFFILVPANATTGKGPDANYLPILQKGTELASKDGNIFILTENVNFADPSNEMVVGRVDEDTGNPTYFVVKVSGKVMSGEIVETSIEVEGHERFRKIELAGDNIAEIISVFDTEGHEYFEVEHLSQDVVYREVMNRETNTDTVKNILKPFVVPRRFIIEQRRDKFILQFGYGSESEIKSDKIADPSEVVLEMHGRQYVIDDSFDPSNLVATDKFGVVPSNTTLIITYRQNKTTDVNIATDSLVEVVESAFVFANIATLDQTLIASVTDSLQVTNESPIVGDVSLPNAVEIKRRAYDHFATQNRIVTKQDYVSYIYSMPPKFGSVKRAGIMQDVDSFKRNLNLYVLSESSDGTLTATNDLIKQNLKVWINKNRMIHDTIDILDGRIVNIGLIFSIIAEEERNKFDVLNDATKALVNFYELFPDFGESFKITDVYSVLNDVDGVLDTYDVEVVLKTGDPHSDVFYNLKKNMSSDGRLIEFGENLIWEIKYPYLDIKGVIQ